MFAESLVSPWQWAWLGVRGCQHGWLQLNLLWELWELFGELLVLGVACWRERVSAWLASVELIVGIVGIVGIVW